MILDYGFGTMTVTTYVILMYQLSLISFCSLLEESLGPCYQWARTQRENIDQSSLCSQALYDLR